MTDLLSTSLDLHDTQRVWDLLAQRIESFVDGWESALQAGSGVGPALDEFVPDRPEAVRRMTLVELIKVDLDYRWKHAWEPRSVEEYATHFPELLVDGSAPGDLLYEEYHVRRRCGDDCTPDDYCRRFPQQADELKRLLGIDSPHTSTALLAKARTEEISVGDSVDDFDLLTRLGSGAFATVFLARQRSLQRLVALKVSANRGAEPQTLAQLDHPHIVRVYDQRILVDRDVRLLYMQYVAGGTLQEAIELVNLIAPAARSGKSLLAAIDRALDTRGESPPIDSTSRGRLAMAHWPEAVCMLGMQLASALDYAHKRGVLHRDLKPANILLSAEGGAKLVDFNISFCSKIEGATPAAYFGGSLAYMSPEQLEACNPSHPREPETLDGRSDLFALGVVLWETLVGTRPFQDEQLEAGWSATLEAMTERRRRGPDPAARQRLSHAGGGDLAEVLQTMMAPEADDRYISAGEAARQLKLCLQPDARRLLRPARRGWRQLVQSWAMPAILMAMLIPNALAGAFNYHYNWENIVRNHLESDAAFDRAALIINGTAFPIGIAIAIWLILPLQLALRRLGRGESPTAEQIPKLRTLCRSLGNISAVIGTAEWLMAGAIYPATMRAMGVELTMNEQMHFFGSLAMCGLIAAAYPFFGVTFLTMCGMYPALVRPGCIDGDEIARLGKLHRLTWFYWMIAAMVPMLGVILLVSLGGAENRAVMIILSAGGMVGALGLFFLLRRVQRDLVTLADVVGNLSTDTLEVSTDSIRARF